MRPHVGTLSAFCSGSHLVLSFHAGPQRGGTRSCQDKGEHYKGTLTGPHTTQLGGSHRVHSSYHPRRLRAVPQDTPKVPLHFSHRNSRASSQLGKPWAGSPDVVSADSPWRIPVK